MKMIFTCLVSLTFFCVSAQNGLDANFGSNGIVVTNILFGGSSDKLNAMALQPDGKITVAGTSYSDPAEPRVVVARYLTNGQLDPTFGSAGIKINDFFPDGIVSADDMVLLSDGKILVAGTANKSGAYANAFVARFHSDGSPDLNFGTNGVGQHGFSFETHKASIGVQSDGKIIVSVNVKTSNSAVFRLTQEGDVDTEFGADPFNTYEAEDFVINDLALQTDNKILIAGVPRFSNPSPKISRLYNNGVLEGTATFSDIQGFFSALALQNDGKIVAVGVTAELGFDFLTVRMNTDGLPDPDFGNEGIVKTPVSASEDDTAKAVTILPSGEILVAGTSFFTLSRQMTAALYNSNGTLQTCFADGGLLKNIDIAGGNEFTSAVAVQQDGKIVIAGGHNSALGLNFALARYINDNLAASISVNAGSTLPGMAANTIYLGYGPQSIQLQANASGGDGDYFYTWSNGSTSASTTVSPTTTTTYQLTVTDGKTCSAMSSVTINVVDARCGKNNDKILVCHSSKGKQSPTCVSANQLQAHLNHGDVIGACTTPVQRKFGQQPGGEKTDVIAEVATIEESILKTLKIYPNPTANAFNLELPFSHEEGKMNLKVHDITGRLVEHKQNLVPGSVIILGNTWSPGIYLVSIEQKNKFTSSRIVKTAH